MIYNQWCVILESKKLKKHKPLRIKRFCETSAGTEKCTNIVCREHYGLKDIITTKNRTVRKTES